MSIRTNLRTNLERVTSHRRLGFLALGLGLGTALAYLLINRARAGEPFPAAPQREHTVDDRGTGQAAAAKMLFALRDRAFEASDEKLALALGRPPEEISAWQTGHEVIDDDVVMKARSIARLRGVVIE